MRVIVETVENINIFLPCGSKYIFFRRPSNQLHYIHMGEVNGNARMPTIKHTSISITIVALNLLIVWAKGKVTTSRNHAMNK